jgi:prophage regulatory protein
MNNQFLNIKQVCEITTLSRATIYRKMNANTFPKSMHLSERTIRWRASDIEDWCNSLVVNSHLKVA